LEEKLLLLTYKVRARNTSKDSENKIHDDVVAASYGFRGGLVPGVMVYGYMTTPIVGRFGTNWLERGSMEVRFLQPFYEGEQVIVRARADVGDQTMSAAIRAEREDGTLCAIGKVSLDEKSRSLDEVRIDEFPETILPEFEHRPAATREAFVIGSPVGSLKTTLDLNDGADAEAMSDKLTFYRGAIAVAHPFTLLSLSNQLLVRNFKLGPWIHASSELKNWSTVSNGERVSVRGRVRDRFEKKGHEFVVLDVLLLAGEQRLVQQVRHTAIYKPRPIAKSSNSEL
jgi:acyl dehydratase